MALKIKSKLFSLAKLAGFIAACVTASFAVIAPLWLFANKAPGVYSWAVLLAAALFVLYKSARAAKKAGLKKSLFFAAKLFIIAAGFALAAISLANFSRLFFFISVLAAAALFGAVRALERHADKGRS